MSNDDEIDVDTGPDGGHRMDEPVSEVGTGNGTGLGVPSKRHQLGRD